MNTMLAYAHRFKFGHEVVYMTAGAAPPPAVMQRFEEEVGVRVRTVCSYITSLQYL